MEPCNQWENKTSKQVREEFKAIKLEYQNIKVDIKPGNYTCCLFLPNSDIAFANHMDDVVLIYKIDGTLSASISIETPFAITSIDDETIAVTGGNTRLISIISLSSNSVVKTIKTEETGCWGITYYDGFLYFVVEWKCIFTLNLSNDNQKRLNYLNDKHYNSHCRSHLTSFGNRLCYTSNENADVVVLKINPDKESAEKVYQVYEPDVINDQGQCTMDEDRHVYVVSPELRQVILVSAQAGYTCSYDNCRKLLGKDDGLIYPSAIDYDRKTKRFMIVNLLSDDDGPLSPYFMIFKKAKPENQADQKS
ncbi:uncharacterized protein LOC127733594 [Mytilus californianus]|uniref:uncharacterized protein LOC127733594 n=1 Tax=Mytilus californianus TaxID=6549 RepID=UPI002247BE09|nr:uncharacterized protein LOC127733594 [Mytilus californianus]